MDTKEIVLNAWEELFNRGNLAATDDYVHPDYTNHEAAAHRPPGPEGMRQTVSWLRNAFSELRFQVEDAIADHDRVALRVQMSGVHTGPLMGMPPTNKPFSVQHIHIFRVADSKIVEHWANRDDLGGMTQLGLLPASPRVEFAHVRQFVEAVVAHEFETAAELLDPDVEIVTPRGSLRGIAACRQVLRKAGGDEQFSTEQAAPEFERIGDDVIARTREIARWRETGELAYERDFALRLTADDDRIVRIVVMPDGAPPSQANRA